MTKSIRARDERGYFYADTFRVAAVAMRFLSFLASFGMLGDIPKTWKGREKA